MGQGRFGRDRSKGKVSTSQQSRWGRVGSCPAGPARRESRGGASLQGREGDRGLPVTQPVRATRGEEAVSVAAVSHFQTSVIFGSLLPHGILSVSYLNMESSSPRAGMVTQQRISSGQQASFPCQHVRPLDSCEKACSVCLLICFQQLRTV